MQHWTMACVLMLSAAAAEAQLGIYGKFDLNHYSTGGMSSTSTNFTGGGVGVFGDILKLGPIHAGVDVRGSFGSGGQQDYRNFLGGARVAVKTPILPLRPYVEGLVGGGGTKYTGPVAAGITSSPYSTKFMYEVLGGLDYTLIPHVDFRVVEIGVGRQTGTSDNIGNNPASRVVAVSTGLVIRL